MNTSYELEQRLKEAIEAQKANMLRSARVRRAIIKLRKARQTAIPLPASTDKIESDEEEEVEE